MSIPSQFFASPGLLKVSIDGCRSDVLFEPVQLGFEILNLPLDIFEFLRPPVSVAHDSSSLDQYFIMLDERFHPAEGGLEGREEISGLLHYVEENFCAIRDSLLLC